MPDVRQSRCDSSFMTTKSHYSKNDSYKKDHYKKMVALQAMEVYMSSHSFISEETGKI